MIFLLLFKFIDILFLWFYKSCVVVWGADLWFSESVLGIVYGSIRCIFFLDGGGCVLIMFRWRNVLERLGIFKV